MIQRAVTAIIGVVIGLFATFAVFGAILGGLDSFYLLTQDACNYGTENAPKRVLRVIEQDDSKPGEVDDLDWSTAITLSRFTGPTGTAQTYQVPPGACAPDRIVGNANRNVTLLTPNGDTFLTVLQDASIGPHSTTSTVATGVSPNRIVGNDVPTWITAENVFTAQRQLVTLLAVIAAIGMPIGAMTAIVFFGQAVISSGVSGQGASQVLVAIAAVVVILVAVQMFQQFAGYLGDAFDAVDGDRFVVFDETLGSLAETIAEFWGVLAFAGLINIATIVWRNYSGNFNIGGTQGGL